MNTVSRIKWRLVLPAAGRVLSLHFHPHRSGPHGRVFVLLFCFVIFLVFGFFFFFLGGGGGGGWVAITRLTEGCPKSS